VYIFFRIFENAGFATDLFTCPSGLFSICTIFQMLQYYPTFIVNSFQLLNFISPFFVHRTTLEQFRAPIFHDNVCDKNGWSLGKMNNLREVMGLFPGAWCLPIPTQVGDGLSFPHARAQQHGTIYNTIPGRCGSQTQGRGGSVADPVPF
jgi:hypothetical protein